MTGETVTPDAVRCYFPGSKKNITMKRTVQSEINEILRRLGKAEIENLIEEAEYYICALCDMERKPCEIHAGAKCAMMIREGTELEHLRRADKQQLSQSYGFCITCGASIERSTLSRNPLAELCNECSPAPRRISA